LGAKPACHIFLAPCTEEVKERFFGVVFVDLCWVLAEESGIEKKRVEMMKKVKNGLEIFFCF
jgi:hypothetical protein